MQVIELLSHNFFRYALYGSLLVSISCGIVGTYIVIRRLVFISGGITHASLGGLGLGFYFGFSPILSALIFSIATAFGIEWLSSKQQVREDSAIASFWSLGMALGIILMFLKPGYSPNLSDYLFGNILTISTTDLLYQSIIALSVCLLFAFCHRPILFIAFDAEFAHTRGLWVKTFEYIMMCLIAITIVISIRLVGIVLLMSMLTIPQMIANIFTTNFVRLMGLSIIISFLACVVGLTLSFYLNVPSGAFIIFVLVIVFLFCKGIHRLSKTYNKE